MPRAAPGSLKALGNKIKSKGLQRLKWYCQVCQKQCRDDNGFKCHTMSEAHQRQLLLVAENPNKVIDTFSDDFKKAFMRLLSRRFNTRRVMAKNVYNEYIQDKEHLHMNATRWHSLTEFIKHLGREGDVIAEETEKGWYITWIDRDPEVLRRQKILERRERLEKDEEQRQAEAIQAQMERDKEAAAARGEGPDRVLEEFKRKGDEDVVTFAMASKKPRVDSATGQSAAEAAATFKASSRAAVAAASFSASKDGSKRKQETRKMSALELIREEEERKKAAIAEKAAAEAAAVAAAEQAAAGDRKDHWLYEGIVVKVMHKELKSGRYYKRKGVVKELVDNYTAKVALLDSSTVLKLDQEYLETVIPAAGGSVLVVNGPFRGIEGVLDSVDFDNFLASITLRQPKNGTSCIQLAYEDFCKLG